MPSSSPSPVRTPPHILVSPSPTTPGGANIRRQRPPRPKITLNIPPPNAGSQVQSPFMYPVPPSAMSGGTNLTYNKAEEMDMFKQIGDFTKAGLGHGEKVKGTH